VRFVCTCWPHVHVGSIQKWCDIVCGAGPTLLDSRHNDWCPFKLIPTARKPMKGLKLVSTNWGGKNNWWRWPKISRVGKRCLVSIPSDHHCERNNEMIKPNLQKSGRKKRFFFSVVTISKLCLLKKEQNLLCWDARKLILSKNQIQTRGRSVLSKQPDCGWPIFSWRQDPEFDSSNKTKSKNEESGS